MVVLIILVFLAFVLLAFFPGKLDFLQQGWVSWIVLIFIIIFFITSAAYIFNWTINWALLEEWAYSEWFGLIFLIIIAGIVSWVLTKK
jgi:hypothetical protein